MITNPEIAKQIQAAGIQTNYHDVGSGEPVLLIHGSGPGVSAWANWRLSLPALSTKFRVIAPDMAGFGFSERPTNYQYSMENWVTQAVGLLDALGLERASLVGNSFGGALALALAIHHPERVNKLVLMGSVGVPFKITEGLDRVWGYEPSLQAMKSLLDIFAYNRALVTDELAELRYQASIRPGFQESFSAMFPAPRQRWVDAMTSALADIWALPHHTLIIHGRDDQVIPLQNAYDLLDLIERSELHVFGQCGHWTQIEHATSFNQLVAEFLERAY
ncbi:alpha/beta hydrolase [uncultured Thiothrix sp.]|uniref:alpha/beta fold hydrolase n=1 Tax=uncultured Thiothrix sp. TaxID=223185 RepID=UPI00260A7BC6|nr:alpha/beta hydrolase [uncultured Thiothrix sp.]HMT92353.1 alpha/beta hydrolase [Thiolinea sp.]